MFYICLRQQKKANNMSVHTFGIVGQPTVTITCFSTVDEDQNFSVNRGGDKLPDKVVERRHRMVVGRRLASQGAGEVRLFPVQ